MSEWNEIEERRLRIFRTRKTMYAVVTILLVLYIVFIYFGAKAMVPGEWSIHQAVMYTIGAGLLLCVLQILQAVGIDVMISQAKMGWPGGPANYGSLSPAQSSSSCVVHMVMWVLLWVALKSGSVIFSAILGGLIVLTSIGALIVDRSVMDM